MLAGAGLSIAARPPMRFQPNPSGVIAAEIAFNRLAQEKGQWTAFRETAAKDAVMFVPQRVLAQSWLKGRADPPKAVRWAPHSVYASCDGRLAASTGGWERPDGSVGYFTTIWRRDDKGQWRWILDHGDRLATARAAPEFMVGKVATCRRSGRAPGEGAPGGPPAPGRPEGVASPPVAAPPGRPGREGGSPFMPLDDSLTWTAEAAADGSRRVTVKMWTGEGYETVIDDRVAAEGMKQ